MEEERRERRERGREIYISRSCFIYFLMGNNQSYSWWRYGLFQALMKMPINEMPSEANSINSELDSFLRLIFNLFLLITTHEAKGASYKWVESFFNVKYKDIKEHLAKQEKGIWEMVNFISLKERTNTNYKKLSSSPILPLFFIPN